MSKPLWDTFSLEPVVPPEARVAAAVPRASASLVALARQRANLILEDARQQAAELSRQARAEGLQAARAEFERERREWLELAQASLSDAFEQMSSEAGQAQRDWQHQQRQELEQQLGALVLASSGRAWERLLRERPESLSESIRECLAEYFSGDNLVTVVADPGRVEALAEQLGLPVRGQAGLGPHDFALVGASGQVSGSLAERLHHLRAALGL